jgi:hypothetical protein
MSSTIAVVKYVCYDIISIPNGVDINNKEVEIEYDCKTEKHLIKYKGKIMNAVDTLKLKPEMVQSMDSNVLDIDDEVALEYCKDLLKKEEKYVRKNAIYTILSVLFVLYASSKILGLL